MNEDQIVAEIVKYLHETNPVAAERGELPLDESLYQLGILDSFGVVETVDFIEKTWAIRILDAEITVEKFGSLNKMAQLVRKKIDAK
jgi:acyl carrier protein